MKTVNDYIFLAKKHLTKSETPFSSCVLTLELENKLNLPLHTLNSLIMGMALAQLNIKSSNGYCASPSGYPRKFKQFFAEVRINNGNLEIDKQKLYCRKSKAKKTRIKNSI
jgi:hypothetical protein